MYMDLSKLKCNEIYGVWHVARYDEISNSLQGDKMKNETAVELHVYQKGPQ